MKYIATLLLMTITLLTSCQSDKPAPHTPAKFPAGVAHPKWSQDATIYEVNVRQYTPEGTFNAFSEHLPRLKAMGVKILWLMPINPIGKKNRKGTLGSYYSVKDYRAVNPEFGNMEDFKALVQRVHELGMYLIIDWVANHSAWDNPLITEHPEWYTHDSTGAIVSPNPDWHDVADFNYEEQGLRDWMTESLKFWVREADIDGYRCDVAGMVPLDFWMDARPELNDLKDLFMLAEWATPEQHRAFDMTYGWDLHHRMNDIYAGKTDASAIDAYLAQHDSTYDRDWYIMYFTTNHDENSWNGTAFERLGESLQAFTVLTFTIPGMPLIYSGQEAGLHKRLSFFEKDTINWQDSRWEGFFTRLVHLKRDHPALWCGNAGGDMLRLPTADNKKVFAFRRVKNDDEVLVVLNLSPAGQRPALKDIPANVNYRELFTGEAANAESLQQLMLPPWSYRVYVKQP